MSSLLVPATILSTSSICGISLPYVYKPLLPYIPTVRPFSTGVIFSISLCHLLPDAIKGCGVIVKPHWLGCLPVAESCAVLGFAAMTVIEAMIPCPHSKGVGGGKLCEGGAGGNGSDKICRAGRIRGLSCESEKSAYDSARESEGVRETYTESTTLLPTVATLSLEGGGKEETTGSYKLQILEFSIAFHSVLIGFPVTTSPSGSLVTALGIHQFFEGVSLGLAGVSAGLDRLEFMKLALIFSLSISLGVSLGYFFSLFNIGSSDTGSDYSKGWEGIGNAIASGVLLFVAVEFYIKDFADPEEVHGRKWGKIISFLLGCTLMTAVSIWT